MPDIFIDDENIIKWINDDIKKLSNELAKFERIKNFIIKRNAFTIEEGDVTPTMKPKRKVIEKKYAEAIEEMYLSSVEED
jgi:long-chain acyl-CoA synthetase